MTSLERALETDIALSERQVARHYGLTLEDCHGLGLIVQSSLVAPTVHRRAIRPVSFVLLGPRELEGFELRHLAGVAEARYQLNADPRDWQVVQHAGRISPDAVWRRGIETWAVEFDAGAYSRAVLLEKARAFRAAYDGQVWAANSRLRCGTLQTVLERTPLLVHPF